MRIVLAITGILCIIAGLAVIGFAFNNGMKVSSPNKSQSIFEHDFGLVKARGVYTHVFEVHNDSANAWKIAALRSSCRCTLAQPSILYVAPGQKTEIAIRYTAPNSNTTEVREVMVVMEDKSAPELLLRIKAKVRQDMAIDNSVVNLGDVARGENKKKRILIRNYGYEAWSRIAIDNLPVGVSYTAERLSPLPSGDGPRETWATDFQVDPTQTEGNFRVNCNVHAIGESGDITTSSRLTIAAKWKTVIEVYPEKIHVPVASRSEYSANISLVLDEKFSSASIPDLQLSHGLVDTLRCDVKKSSERRWTIECSFVENAIIPAKSQLTIRLGEISIDVPISQNKSILP